MEVNFTNQEELYDRIYPALHIMAQEVKKTTFIKIEEKDIWEYLKNNIWNNTIELSLSVMVEDVFDLDIKTFINYIIKRRQDLL